MRIAFVELAGFRGFKDKVRFDFPAGFAVLSGPNGAGKSTVMDAVDFALTGTINKYSVTEAKGGGLESHLWWVGEGVPAEQYVTVGFEEATGELFEVTRSRERGLLVPQEEFAKRLCVGPTYTPDWASTFMQTTLIRDETIAALSLDLPEQARFTAVRSAIGGLGGRDHSKRTRQLIEAASSIRDDQEKRVSIAEAELGRALSALTEAKSVTNKESKVAEADTIIDSLVPDLSSTPGNRTDALRTVIAKRKRSLQAAQEAAVKAERALAISAELDSVTGLHELDAARSSLQEAQTALNAAQTRVADQQQIVEAERVVDEFATHLSALLEDGQAVGLQEGHCPLCAAPRTVEEFLTAISSARAQLSDRGDRIRIAMAQLEEAQKVAAQSVNAVSSAERRLAELDQRKIEVERELENVRTAYREGGISLDPSDLDGVREHLLRNREDTARLEQALFILESSGAQDRVISLQARVEQLRSVLEQESEKFASAERAVEFAKQIDNAAKTVANQVMAEQFDTVMPLLKELYSRLRPHADWREIEIDFGGRIRASLNFTVGDGKNPQFLFSSGQRRAAGLAFLLSIHLSRPWCALQTLMLDDPIQHIDDYRALNLVEVLSAIRRTGRQVIVSVQDSALADVLCRRLRSTNGEPGIRFDLFTKPNGSAGILEQTDTVALPQYAMRIAEAS